MSKEKPAKEKPVDNAAALLAENEALKARLVEAEKPKLSGVPDGVKLSKDGLVKYVSNEKLVELLLKDGWTKA